ncbi:hypothetical protein BDW74DRAFT_158968 [Aspergillus multicolor]|uniref:uncharacterized protein n=1 Tax=Aspergillus multicolor TaxID=41759 RepID=UPI003CCD32FA
MGLLDGADMCDERHPQKLEAYIRPEASWRQMHVQQPPVRELGIFEARYTEFEGESYHVYEISVCESAFRMVLMDNQLTLLYEAYENGLTMGEYFEFLLFHNVMKGAARIVSWGKSTWPPWSRMMWMMGRTHDSDIMLRISAAVSRDEAGSSEYVPTETDLRRERICAEYERLGVEVHPLPDIPRWNEWEE